jgi:tetratricopeptide (TPR) repeat protein
LDRQAAAGCEPRTEMEYLTRGWSRLPKHPNEALADFRAASRLNPQSGTALRQQVYVLSDLLGKNEDALKTITRLVEMYPEDTAARAHKALVHARLGDRNSAIKEAEKVEAAEKNPNVLFQLGRAYSLTSRFHAEDQSKAISLLNRAFLGGFRHMTAYQSCAELEPLRGTIEFEAFLVRIREMLI